LLVYPKSKTRSDIPYRSLTDFLSDFDECQKLVLRNVRDAFPYSPRGVGYAIKVTLCKPNYFGEPKHKSTFAIVLNVRN